MRDPQTTPADDVLAVETPESVAFDVELAGIASRGLALLADTGIIVVFAGAELLVVAGLTWVVANVFDTYNLAWSIAAWALAAFVTYQGYFIWGEVRDNGRTWGKKRVGLRVVRDDGGRVGTLDSAIRNLVRVVDMLPGVYGVGILAAMLSERSKRLGDLAAGTIVVRDTTELGTLYEGGTGDSRDALAREYLERRAELSDDARYQVAVEVLAAYGEEPGYWDEPQVAGRLAELCGLRAAGAGGAEQGAGQTGGGASATVNRSND